MQFDSLESLLVMDGHGIFVWSVYLFTLLVLACLVAMPALRNRRFWQQQGVRQRREQRAVESANAEVGSYSEEVGKQ